MFALSSDGQTLLFSTFLATPSDSSAHALAFDGVGNIYLTGLTGYGLQTTPDALQPNYGGGYTNALLIKLDPKASKNLYSTNFGGSGFDGASDVKVDSNGYISMSGFTSSPNFPVKNPLQQYNGGGADGWDDFMVKIAPDNSLVYSTPFGGTGGEGESPMLALAGNGGVYVASATGSYDFPVKNAFQPTYGGGYDGTFWLIADSTPVAPSPLTTSPGVLSFSYSQGAAAPPAQTVNVTGGTFVASSSTDWLSWTTQAGSAGVTVNPANLAPGTYNGTLTITPSSGTPASIAVTLVVFAPPPALTSLNPSLITAGSSDTLITINGPGFTANTSLLFAGQAWTTAPVQFVNSSTLTVNMPPTALSGVTTWSIAVQNPQTQPSNPLSLNVGVAVENAASYISGPVAPGEIVTILGSGLSGAVTFEGTRLPSPTSRQRRSM